MNMLYGAEHIEQLKKKIQIHEIVKSKLNDSDDKARKRKLGSDTKLHVEPLCCYNCGAAENQALKCKFKNQATKWFTCNKFVHETDKMFKSSKVNSIKAREFIDIALAST